LGMKRQDTGGKDASKKRQLPSGKAAIKEQKGKTLPKGVRNTVAHLLKKIGGVGEMGAVTKGVRTQQEKKDHSDPGCPSLRNPKFEKKEMVEGMILSVVAPRRQGM